MLCPEKAAFYRTSSCLPDLPFFLTKFPEPWKGKGGDGDAPCEVEYSQLLILSTLNNHGNVFLHSPLPLKTEQEPLTKVGRSTNLWL